MRIFNAVLAAACITLTVASAAPDASARGFHGGFHGGFHRGFHRGHSHWGHSHWGHRFHRWGFRSHVGYRYGFHRWGYRHYGYRVGYRPYRVAVNVAPRACPAGFHLGYLGRFCHPNRY